MYTQSLIGTWQFREARTGTGPEQSDEEWLPARVPGSVHTDLLAFGRIPDPFVGDNELHVQWVAERDWEYRLTFQVAPRTGLLAEERVFLVCDGLDTLADVALNGQPVGHAENAFRQCRWDVKAALTEDENELLVSFPSPLAYIRERLEEPLREALGHADFTVRKEVETGTGTENLSALLYHAGSRPSGATDQVGRPFYGALLTWYILPRAPEKPEGEEDDELDLDEE